MSTGGSRGTEGEKGLGGADSAEGTVGARPSCVRITGADLQNRGAAAAAAAAAAAGRKRDGGGDQVKVVVGRKPRFRPTVLVRRCGRPKAKPRRRAPLSPLRPLRAAGDKTAPSAGGAVRRTRVDRRGLRRGKVSRAGDPQQAALVYCDAASRLGAGAAWATDYSRTGGLVARLDESAPGPDRQTGRVCAFALA